MDDREIEIELGLRRRPVKWHDPLILFVVWFVAVCVIAFVLHV